VEANGGTPVIPAEPVIDAGAAVLPGERVRALLQLPKDVVEIAHGTHPCGVSPLLNVDAAPLWRSVI
jgi:hypothetical protein